jgi:hypothetical protein
MGIGISIVAGVIGAVLRYALTVPANQQGFDLHTAGVILMFAGGLGLVLSLLFWSSVAPFARSSSRRETVVSRNGQEAEHVVRETRDVSH